MKLTTNQQLAILDGYKWFHHQYSYMGEDGEYLQLGKRDQYTNTHLATPAQINNPKIEKQNTAPQYNKDFNLIIPLLQKLWPESVYRLNSRTKAADLCEYLLNYIEATQKD